jgi:hypothetical protein
VLGALVLQTWSPAQEALHWATFPPACGVRQQTSMLGQSAEDEQSSSVAVGLEHIVPFTQVAWICIMTRSTQQVCALVQVAPPHEIPPPPSPPPLDPPPSDADPSEPLAEASPPLLPDAPLLDVLLLVPLPLDVLPDPPVLDALPELPPLEAPLLDIELPDEDPLPDPPDPPFELPPPPSSPLPLTGLDPLHAANPNKVPTRATTGIRIIASSSGTGGIPHQARASERPPGGQWERDADSLPPFAKRRAARCGRFAHECSQVARWSLTPPSSTASCNV